MDPLHVIITALALGAAAGAESNAQQAVKDAYSAFKALLLRKFGAKGDTAKAVEAVEAKPESVPRQEVLKEELVGAGAGDDQEAIDRATELLTLLKYRSSGATGGQVGEINAPGGSVFVVQGDVHGGVKM